MAHVDSSALFGLYRQLAPAELFRLLQREIGWKARAGIYTTRLVLWMMMIQRLEPRGSLASSVAQLVEGRFDPLLSACKRVQEKKIGLSTGGYCQARQRLPKLLVSRSMDELIERLRGRLLELQPRLPHRLYLLDGSSLQLEHERELVEAYPPVTNQHGRSHWPMLKIVVLHDLETGLAERPYWGPMNGGKAVSEQALAERAMKHIPAGSVIVGDRNFGIFATAYGAQQAGQKCIVRLTAVRAQSLMGGPIEREGSYPVRWRSSRWDGRKKGNPQPAPWPADASVEGRLIASRVGRGKRKQWLYLFTTTSLSAEEVVALYSRRWRIETDLRSLKQTVRLSRIHAHSTDMIEKELWVAVMAYNLVRAIMFQAALRAQIEPRQLSFTYACNIVIDSYPDVLAARTCRQQEQKLDRMIDLVARCRLPNRTKRRFYPRAVWGRGYHFPTRQEEQN
ncbi:MAG TPA: IS4 family transposase [Bryobacteraceae bacterium]|nr:IS4 family transposase [Bryobacteraceae bacterium]